MEETPYQHACLCVRNCACMSCSLLAYPQYCNRDISSLQHPQPRISLSHLDIGLIEKKHFSCFLWEIRIVVGGGYEYYGGDFLSCLFISNCEQHKESSDYSFCFIDVGIMDSLQKKEKETEGKKEKSNLYFDILTLKASTRILFQFIGFS